MITEADAKAAVDSGSNRERAPEPGTSETIGAVSTPVLPAFDRNGAYLFNQGAETVFVRLAADGAVVDEGIVIPAGTGQVISGYDGALCAISATGGNELAVAAV